MPINRKFWLEPFPKNHFPNWACPKCGIGILQPLEKTFSVDEAGDITIERNRNGEYFDHDAYTFRYSVLLKCNNPDCQERISSCGHGYVEEKFTTADGKIIFDEDGVPDSYYLDVFVPEYFYPALNLITVSKKCPERVAQEIKQSFKLFFADPSASANYVRKAVEEILTNKGVVRFATSNKGKRTRISLHDRIVAFERMKPEIAKKLLAIKWLGNEGSHTDTISKNDVLDAYEILDWVLDELYVGYRMQLEKKVAKINKTKRALHPST